MPSKQCIFKETHKYTNLSNSEQNCFCLDKKGAAYNEIYHQQKWFSQYDNLIFKIRGWFSSVLIAIFIALIHNKNVIYPVFILTFSFWAMSVELFWLYHYWVRRSLRHLLLIDIINDIDNIKIEKFTLCDFTGTTFDQKNDGLFVLLKQSHALPRCQEIIFFYISISLAAILLKYLII